VCGIIYIATNKINEKVYIGQTTMTLETRKRGHLYHANGTKKKFFFQYALLKYGEENFTWKKIDESDTLEELNEKEIYWISHYKSAGTQLYNMSMGGSAFGNSRKSIHQFDAQGNFIKKYNSAKEISSEMNVSKEYIAQCCRGRSNKAGDYIYLYAEEWTLETEKKELERRLQSIIKWEVHSEKKKIVTYDKFLNKKVFDSINQTSKEIGVSSFSISLVCMGTNRTARQHAFFYEKDVPVEETVEYQSFLEDVKNRFTNLKGTREESGVYQVDLNGDITIFPTIRECYTKIEMGRERMLQILDSTLAYHDKYFYFRKGEYMEQEFKNQRAKWGEYVERVSKSIPANLLTDALKANRNSILQFSTEGIFVAHHKGSKDAFRKTGIKCATIQNNLRGRSKVGRGFIWLYASDYSNHEELVQEIRQRVFGINQVQIPS
jgi:group I intron endonuclease